MDCCLCSAYCNRVPIYAASSWASIISLKASLWLAPIRDVYEVIPISGQLVLSPLMDRILGLYDLYFLPTPHQLSRW